MKREHAVIAAPVITEKGTLVNEAGNQVVFKVHPDANKVEIKRAVERLFKVKVLKVRTGNFLGKTRRVGRSMGRRPDWKKAYVVLKEGEKMVEFFDQA